MTQEDLKEIKVDKPDDRLTINLKEERKELFMSGGLIRELAHIIGTLDNLEMFYIDSHYQELCILRTLVDRDNRGQVTEEDKERSLSSFPLTIEDCDKIRDWIGGHLMYFFIKSVLSLTTNLKDQTETFSQLAQLQDGIRNLMGEKPSVGPTI